MPSVFNPFGTGFSDEIVSHFQRLFFDETGRFKRHGAPRRRGASSSRYAANKRARNRRRNVLAKASRKANRR